MKQIRVCSNWGRRFRSDCIYFCCKRRRSSYSFGKKRKTCKKLLMTGNGRCNFTNEYQKLDCYHSYHEKESQFIREVFEQFSMEETVEFFKRIGIYPKSRNGYLYPASNQASSVAEVLEAEARFRKVKIKLNDRCLQLKKTNKVIRGW